MFYGSVNVTASLYASCPRVSEVVLCSVVSVCVAGSGKVWEVEIVSVKCPTVVAELSVCETGTFECSDVSSEIDTLVSVEVVRREVDINHLALWWTDEVDRVVTSWKSSLESLVKLLLNVWMKVVWNGVVVWKDRTVFVCG